MLSKIDRKIVVSISKDLPLADRPFREIADRLNITEDKLLSRIKDYKKRGLLRKFSAVLHHINAGFKYNAMCVWNVPEKLVAKSGNLIAGFSEVSHCYQRKKYPDWNYNLYAMVHGKTKSECLSVAERISQKIGFGDFRVLFSSKEFKKTGVRYE